MKIYLVSDELKNTSFTLTKRSHTFTAEQEKDLIFSSIYTRLDMEVIWNR